MLTWIKELRDNPSTVGWPLFVALVIGAICGFAVSTFWWSGTVSTLREQVSLLQQTRIAGQLHIVEVNKGPSYRVEPGDDIIEVNSLDNAPITIFLPSGFVKGKEITVKDKRGNANEVNIDIVSDAGTIEGLKKLVINVDREAFALIWDGKEWSII